MAGREPTGLHTKQGGGGRRGGSADLLARMTLYIMDPGGGQRWQQSLRKQEGRWGGGGRGVLSS